ncbi:unnamed protein product [Cochlearia groenlandica]
MSNLSSGSTSNEIRGIPKRCECGEKIVVLVSTIPKNPKRKFYRCAAAKQGEYGHVFKWLEETRAEEFDVLAERQELLLEDLRKLMLHSVNVNLRLNNNTTKLNQNKKDKPNHTQIR